MIAPVLADDGVVHVVLLWLKEDGALEEREELIEATRRLRAVPGVVDIRMGESIPSERDIVDDSFDVGIYFYFDSREAMNDYLVHPLHKQVVEEDIRPRVSRIRVHDFTHSKP